MFQLRSPPLIRTSVYSVPKSIDVLLRHIQAYSALHVTLTCSQPCHIPCIQNQANSEPWFDQAYSEPWFDIVRTVYSDINQPYSGIFRTLCNVCICWNLAYSESWNIQNSFIIVSPRIFRTLSYLRKWQTLCNSGNSEPWHIDNPGIFRTLTYLKPDTYVEPSQRLKMTCFAKIVTSYNYFFKALYLRSMTEFFDRVLRASLSKYPLTCRVISRYVFWNTYWETCQLS